MVKKTLKNKAVFPLSINELSALELSALELSAIELSALESFNFQLEGHYVWKGNANIEK
jgi:hypothetical protein